MLRLIDGVFAIGQARLPGRGLVCNDPPRNTSPSRIITLIKISLASQSPEHRADDGEQ